MLSSESIREKAHKCKSAAEQLVRRLYMPIVVILVGISAFAFGELSGKGATQSGITQVAMPAVAREPLTIGGLIVASKRGSKYHYPWCSGARNISEQNKIWFKSAEDALVAGYMPAKNCKGLE